MDGGSLIHLSVVTIDPKCMKACKGIDMEFT